MKIGNKFNKLTCREYIRVIEDRHKYTDFNSLGLYRSIVENQKLELVEKIAIRDLAHKYFFKTFEFLQLKDPDTYFKVSTLDRELTIADERQFWKNIQTSQERILKQKRIKHRSFGTYSKHICGYEGCPYDGVMIPNGSHRYQQMYFDSDRNNCSGLLQAEREQVEKRRFRDARIDLSDCFSIDSDL